MAIRKLNMAIYSLLLTNWYGLKLKFFSDPQKIKELRLNYSKTLLKKLNISVEVVNKEHLIDNKQYLILCNHRGILDPLIVELALQESNIFGYWIAKKELYNSPFFGMFVRNAGTILLDREQKQMINFFADVKTKVKDGASIFIFPEGTRNKTNSPLIDFKDGFRIIALKNRLPILPVYINTRTDKALNKSLNSKSINQQITITIGEEIGYKSKENIQELYKSMFNLH